MEKIYVIVRHDEIDASHNPHYYVKTEAEAIAAVKRLNEIDGLNVILEDDGSLADIVDDDAIWFDYHEVEPYNEKEVQ